MKGIYPIFQIGWTSRVTNMNKYHTQTPDTISPLFPLVRRGWQLQSILIGCEHDLWDGIIIPLNRYGLFSVMEIRYMEPCLARPSYFPFTVFSDTNNADGISLNRAEQMYTSGSSCISSDVIQCLLSIVLIDLHISLKTDDIRTMYYGNGWA